MSPQIKSFLEKCTPTDVPFIYEYSKPDFNKDLFTLFVFSGLSGSGKSTLMKSITELMPRIQTATTRKKREEENTDVYLWMDGKRNNEENLEDFQVRLIKKYDLIESDFHEGNLYGIPRKNILNVLNKTDAVIDIEKKGIATLRKIFKGKFNMICLFILPDKFEQVINRIESNRNDIDIRVAFSKDQLDSSFSFTNYYIHNTELDIYSKDENPLRFTQKNLVEFINRFRKF